MAAPRWHCCRRFSRSCCELNRCRERYRFAMTLSYPPRELWPDRLYQLPELHYPDSLNACAELLDKNVAEGRGAAPAIYFNDSVLTYSEVLEEVKRIASMLRQQGVEPGDRVALRLYNRPHFITT